MWAEHLVYSVAIAIVAGMVYLRMTGRDPSWIIILCAFAPDLDKLLLPIQWLLGLRIVIAGEVIRHGSLHTIWALAAFALIAAVLLPFFGVRRFDAFLFAALGYGAHLFEDALVFNPGYPFFWPFLPGFDSFGLYRYQYPPDLLIADSFVLFIGVLLVLAAAMLRTAVEGPGWLRYYLPAAAPAGEPGY
jgi:membrane-bound metal-dependent hydrolase YbcI (DUF457 family)